MLRIVAVAWFLIFSVIALPAQERIGAAKEAVGRISFIKGQADVKRGNEGELLAATTNAPLLAQDRLQTGVGSVAEVQLDYGNMVRLAPDTDLGMPVLQDQYYQLQLAMGTITYRVLRNADAQAEVDTPNLAARPLGQGEFRISVFEDGTTQITVRSGELEIYGPLGSQTFGGGKTLLVRGGISGAEFQIVDELRRDQFDQWGEKRDRRLLASQSYRYVSPDIVGADDLDQYGAWVPSRYGVVWSPRPPVPGWAPYSDGHWVWEGGYSWSWVDDASWGWAPYHYGRWFWNGRFGWCWWPGAAFAHYRWSPAVVGFFGYRGAGIGLGFGNIGELGWVALAPSEHFYPWWGKNAGGQYMQEGSSSGSEIIHNADVANVYRNARIDGGAITNNYNVFGVVNPHFGRARFHELLRASLVRGRIPLAPVKINVRRTARFAFVDEKFAIAEQRPFFERQQAPQSTFNSFARQGTGEGWQHFGTPGVASGLHQGAAVEKDSSEESGWHDFGKPVQAPPQR